MIESFNDKFAPYVGSVFVSFDKVSIKGAIYVREYDPIYDNARMEKYFITKKSFFNYINKVFNENKDISASVAAKINNGELILPPHIQNDFHKHGYFIGEKDDDGFFKLRKLTVGEAVLNEI